MKMKNEKEEKEECCGEQEMMGEVAVIYTQQVAAKCLFSLRPANGHRLTSLTHHCQNAVYEGSHFQILILYP